MDENTAYYPIVYVRGYAMTQGEINETTADPFCGFNLGSTVYRATPDKGRPARKFIFESPVVRLASDYGYSDIYSEGLDIADDEWTEPISRRSISDGPSDSGSESSSAPSTIRGRAHS